ncbi:acyltransferase family protein [Micromonospora sp. NBC_01796]|uniref:acyltransferase family protein n=1 Tax=Micromonospora sp. NBC_01796 TaxID=2975987 RepID=UPI002DDC75DF|nr:acyltransferase [Micromonospora sp. NBC_01796]WSA87056.1 acyltransferase [Micromonospora sp. NBC_01796]
MTSTPTATAAGRPLSKLPSLTGLRWIAAMLVFGFHVGTMRVIAEPDYHAVVSKVFTLGLSGVQFFFILSGFVLVWSARPGDTPLAFWRRRAAKIFPNHVVLWAAVLLLGLYWADPFNLKVALTNLFLVQAWNPTPGWFYSVNTVSWSLSCELFFYLCLPLVLPLIRRLRPWVLVAVIVAMPLLILSLWPGQLLVPEADRWWFTQVFPLVRSLEFWMGVAAAELMVRGRWRGPNLKVATVIFLLTWVAATQWIRAELWTTLLAAAYILVIAAAAEADVRGTWSPWRSRPMRWLGEVSFAYYLVHVFVVTSILRATNHQGGFPGWQGPAAAIGFLLLNLVLAGLLYRFVETPTMRLLGPRRRPPSTSPPPARVPRQPGPTDRNGNSDPGTAHDPVGDRATPQGRSAERVN